MFIIDLISFQFPLFVVHESLLIPQNWVRLFVIQESSIVASTLALLISLPLSPLISLKIFLPHLISQCAATYSVREVKYNINSCPNNPNDTVHTNFISASHPLASSHIITPLPSIRIGRILRCGNQLVDQVHEVIKCNFLGRFPPALLIWESLLRFKTVSTSRNVVPSYTHNKIG